MTTLTVECGWCGAHMGTKPGHGQTGVSTGMCDGCFRENVDSGNHAAWMLGRALWLFLALCALVLAVAL